MKIYYKISRFPKIGSLYRRCTALVPFVSSMASIFRVGYEARYTVSHSSFRSVLPGKCSIIRKITRDVEEKGAREICSQTFLTDRNDSLELSAFFIRSEEIDLSWHATPSKIEIPSFLFPLPQLEFTYAFEFFWCLQFVP